MSKKDNAPTLEKKKFKAPHLFTLIMCLLVFASILTYIIPAGQFDLDEKGRVIAGTFHWVEKTPVNLWDALMQIQPGLVKSAATSLNVLFAGGLTAAYIANGAIDRVIKMAIGKLKDKGVKVMLPIVILFMSLLGAFAANDSFAAFTIVGIVFAMRLGLDPIIAVMAFYGASYIGFATGPNKINVTAQMISDVTLYSGFNMRMIIWLIMTIIGIIYTMRYANKILADPSKSYMSRPKDQWWDASQSTELSDDYVVEFNIKDVLAVVFYFCQFIFIAYMAINHGWSNAHRLAVMTVVNIFISCIMYRKSLREFGDAFIKGCGTVAFISILIGLASSISLILEGGQILATIIYYVTMPLAGMAKGISAIFIYIFNTLFNFLIPSGSGQAAIVMPLMTPIGDLLGLERQVVVEAFQLGDGLSNLLWPTVGVTVGALSIAKVSYDEWLKFIGPLFLYWTVVACVILFILAMVGWTGMGII